MILARNEGQRSIKRDQRNECLKRERERARTGEKVHRLDE